MGQVYTYPVLIKETYLDSFGHVNNAVYLTLFEEARWEIFNKFNYGIQKIRETGIGPTLLEVNLKFIRELKARDQVIIRTENLSIEKYLFKVSQKILRNEEVCCEGLFTIACYDINQRRLVKPTPDILKIAE